MCTGVHVVVVSVQTLDAVTLVMMLNVVTWITVTVGCRGGGPRVVVSTAAFHARVRGSGSGFGERNKKNSSGFGERNKKNSSPSTCESQYCGEPL